MSGDIRGTFASPGAAWHHDVTHAASASSATVARSRAVYETALGMDPCGPVGAPAGRSPFPDLGAARRSIPFTGNAPVRWLAIAVLAKMMSLVPFRMLQVIGSRGWCRHCFEGGILVNNGISPHKSSKNSCCLCNKHRAGGCREDCLAARSMGHPTAPPASTAGVSDAVGASPGDVVRYSSAIAFIPQAEVSPEVRIPGAGAKRHSSDQGTTHLVDMPRKATKQGRFVSGPSGKPSTIISLSSDDSDDDDEDDMIAAAQPSLPSARAGIFPSSSFPGSSSVRSPPAAQAEPAGGFSSPIPGCSHSPLAAPECPAVINLVSPGPDKPADWSGVDSAQAAALAAPAIIFEEHSRSSSPAHSRVDTTGGSHDEVYL